MSHWWMTDRERYQAIAEPEAFFTSLGEQVEAAIQSLTDELARATPPRRDYLAEVGRLNLTRLQAEELVLADLTLVERAGEQEQDATSGSLVAEIRAILDQIDPEPDDRVA